MELKMGNTSNSGIELLTVASHEAIISEADSAEGSVTACSDVMYVSSTKPRVATEYIKDNNNLHSQNLNQMKAKNVREN